MKVEEEKDHYHEQALRERATTNHQDHHGRATRLVHKAEASVKIARIGQPHVGQVHNTWWPSNGSEEKGIVDWACGQVKSSDSIAKEEGSIWVVDKGKAGGDGGKLKWEEEKGSSCGSAGIPWDSGGSKGVSQANIGVEQGVGIG